MLRLGSQGVLRRPTVATLIERGDVKRGRRGSEKAEKEVVAVDALAEAWAKSAEQGKSGGRDADRAQRRCRLWALRGSGTTVASKRVSQSGKAALTWVVKKGMFSGPRTYSSTAVTVSVLPVA